jgi:hypothetical protein
MKELNNIKEYINYIITNRNNVQLEISHEKLVEDYNRFFDQITSIVKK